MAWPTKAQRKRKKQQWRQQRLQQSTSTSEHHPNTLPMTTHPYQFRSQEDETDDPLLNLLPEPSSPSRPLPYHSISADQSLSVQGMEHPSTAALITENKALEDENKKLEAEEDLLRFIISGQDAKIASLSKQAADLQNQAEGRIEKLKELDGEIEDLKQQVEMLKAQVGDSAATD